MLRLEKRFSAEYEKETGIKPFNSSFGFFKNLRDGDLYRYLSKLYSNDPSDLRSQTKSGIKRREWYKNHGYSPLDYLDAHINELDLEDRLFIEALAPNDVVNKYDICAILGSYDLMKGMYQSKDSQGNTIAICLSCPNNRTQYHDRWIIERQLYFYNMQKEHHTANTGLSFKNPVNKLLFRDFVESSVLAHPKIPVYLFIQYPKRKKEYIFEGVFYVNSLSKDMDAFEFVKGELKITEQFRKRKKNTIDSIMGLDNSKSIGKRVIKEISLFDPSEYEDVSKDISFSDPPVFKSREEEKHDYLQNERIDQKIGARGEEMALTYEKDWVAKHLPSKVNDVKLAGDSMGYDIRSFRKHGNKIVEIHIEVKTTRYDNPYCEFYMSEHEKWYMENHPDTYWLYRIFDIYSENVQGVRITNDVVNRINMHASKYVCHLKANSNPSALNESLNKEI